VARVGHLDPQNLLKPVDASLGMVMWSILLMTQLSAALQAMVVLVATWQMNGLSRVA